MLQPVSGAEGTQHRGVYSIRIEGFVGCLAGELYLGPAHVNGC